MDDIEGIPQLIMVGATGDRICDFELYYGRRIDDTPVAFSELTGSSCCRLLS